MSKLDVTALRFSHIINGKPVPSNRTSQVKNPATGAFLADVPVASREQLDECVAAARAAQPAWAAKSYDERAAVLNKLADELENNVALYSQLLTAEQGKPVRSFVAPNADIDFLLACRCDVGDWRLGSLVA